MLDARFIRENVDAVKLNTKQRNVDPIVVDDWLKVDKLRKTTISRMEEIRKIKNSGGANISDDDRKAIIKLKAELQALTDKLALQESEWNNLINQIPNMHSSDVPIGKTEDSNVVVYTHGEPTKFDFKPKSHADIAVERDLIDFERGAKVAGSQFYYLKGDMVLLENAVIQFVFDMAIQHGFIPLRTPDLARSRFYLGTGYSPRGDEAQTYEIDGADLGLIATSEVTTAGYHADEVIDGASLPIKYISISNCFRREAGSYGKYSKGLYRTHQFTKLEMFIYCKEDAAVEHHEEILSIEKKIMETLEIPYRILNICSGDLGAMAVKKYDVEAWMPGRNDYGEVTSASNCGDFQSRNLNIRYKDNGRTDYVIMLNGTAAALSRTLIAIIENYQQADGSIKIPKALQKYMLGNKTVI